MHYTLKGALLIAVGVTLATACSKKQGPAPNPGPAVTNVAPVRPPPPPVQEQAAAPAASFDGEWKGDSGANLPFSFSVQGNQVTSLNASYSGRNGTCSFNGSLSSEAPSAINNKTFTVKGRSPRDPIEFTASGTLTSSTEASGTLVWKGNSGLCGDIDLQYKWIAKKEPAEPI